MSDRMMRLSIMHGRTDALYLNDHRLCDTRHNGMMQEVRGWDVRAKDVIDAIGLSYPTPAMIEAGARAYDKARCEVNEAAHGGACEPMSEGNLETVMPMVKAAFVTMLQAAQVPASIAIAGDLT